MNLRLRLWVAASVILAIAGCSHGTVSDLPTAPTAAPAATIIRLTITPVGGLNLLAGETSEITTSGAFPNRGTLLGAFAEYTDGSGEYVPAAWTSSDSNVLVVTGPSAMKAISRGVVTLTATARGHTATETFGVMPGIPGTWSGRYVVDQCTAGSGSMQELVCSRIQGRQPGMFAVGTLAPITFLISQTGTTLTGPAAFGEMRGTLTGTDRGQNKLTLRGDVSLGDTTLSVTYWDGQVAEDRMGAAIGFDVRIAGVPSQALVTAHFVDVTRR